MKITLIFKKAVILLMVAVLLGLTGCGESDDYPQDNTEKSITESLLPYGGWWKRPDGYQADFFCVDTYNGTWTIYDHSGNAEETFDCWADGDTFTLENIGFGDMEFQYIDGTLTYEGEIQYVRGEPMEPMYRDKFVGYWYKSGALDGTILIFNEYDYECFSKDAPIEKGTWKAVHRYVWDNGDGSIWYSDNKNNQNYEPDYDEYVVILEATQGDSLSETYILSTDGMTILSESGEEIYVLESALDTPEMQYQLDRHLLITYEWLNEARYDKQVEYNKITFSNNGQLCGYTNEIIDGTNKVIIGTWDFDGETIGLYFSDGVTEHVPFSYESFTVERYGDVFKGELR